MDREELLTIARGMSARDRAYIAAALDEDESQPELDADGWAVDVSPEVRAELRRRIALTDSDPSRLLTREQFWARVEELTKSRT